MIKEATKFQGQFLYIISRIFMILINQNTIKRLIHSLNAKIDIQISYRFVTQQPDYFFQF